MTALTIRGFSRFLFRVSRLVRKPPGFILRRACDEARREFVARQLSAARRGRGKVAPGRILPVSSAEAQSRTALQASTMTPLRTGIERSRRVPALMADIDSRAERARKHVIELFGPSPVAVGSPPRWNVDVHSGHSWPNRCYRRIDYRNIERASDVKVPWELSRLRHCVALAQAVSVLGDQASLRVLDADLRDWHKENPVGWSVNWTCAMEVALRAVNLICMDAILLAGGRHSPGRPHIVSSLYQHGWFLYRNLEISDVNGNHYLANAVGLLWLGRYFGAIGEAPRWFAQGVEMAREASVEHVLGDGLDHEGSLPYHVLVLELFLASRIGGGAATSFLDPTIRAMVDAASAFTTSSGNVPNIGDDDGGRVFAFADTDSRDARRVLTLAAGVLGADDEVPAAESGWVQDALWLTGRVPRIANGLAGGPRPRAFKDAGLVLLGHGDDHVALDVGPIGFRGRGGHGHVDAMSFEAVLGGRMAVRDSGTGAYTRDAMLRNELRGARAHTLVQLDGRSYARPGDKTRLWRIDGDSPPSLIELAGDRSRQVAYAEHEIPSARGHGRYSRRLVWQPGRLTWTDRVNASAGCEVEHIIQLPDEVVLQRDGFAGGGFLYAISAPRDAELSIEAARRSDRYGSVTDARRGLVRYRSTGDDTVTCEVRPVK